MIIRKYLNHLPKTSFGLQESYKSQKCLQHRKKNKIYLKLTQEVTSFNSE